MSPLIAGDYVYTVPHWPTDNGTNQNGGYIRVLDAKTGVEAWGVQVYKTKYAKDHSNIQNMIYMPVGPFNVRMDVHYKMLSLNRTFIIVFCQ